MKFHTSVKVLSCVLLFTLSASTAQANDKETSQVSVMDWFKNIVVVTRSGGTKGKP